VRQAINLGVNRKNIAASSYLGQATATATPFKAGFKELDKIDIVGAEGDLEKAIGILERNGYDDFNSDGIRTNGVSALRVNILVCTENKYKVNVAENFKAELEKLGFGVSITKKKTAEDFTAALTEGHYSFYIGETQLTPNCDLTEFFSEGGNLSYGIGEEMFIEYSSYKSNEINTVTFVENFCANVPFLPLFYKKAVVSVNPNIEGLGADGSLYSSINNWKLKS
jgi:ABC-type transport system substrate-binding protein